ncbi:MAG TPA: cytochrome C oxidase subunit IV family protein [Actinomycetota bacterium]|jgi:cytochrome c oxidase subunit 4|nr:cytochrome C oxidase subunit IV family protein [Actinomycetota bacterium]
MSDVETHETDLTGQEAYAARTRRGRTVRHPSPKEYIRIAIVLGVVTAAEVAIYYIESLRSLLIPMLFVLATIKFSLVVLWFMHLRFDSKTYARFFLLGVSGAVTLYVIVLLTFGAFSR